MGSRIPRTAVIISISKKLPRNVHGFPWAPLLPQRGRLMLQGICKSAALAGSSMKRCLRWHHLLALVVGVGGHHPPALVVVTLVGGQWRLPLPQIKLAEAARLRVVQ